MTVEDMAEEYTIGLGWLRCIVTVQYLLGDEPALDMLEGLQDGEVLA